MNGGDRKAVAPRAQVSRAAGDFAANTEGYRAASSGRFKVDDCHRYLLVVASFRGGGVFSGCRLLCGAVGCARQVVSVFRGDTSTNERFVFVRQVPSET